MSGSSARNVSRGFIPARAQVSAGVNQGVEEIGDHHTGNVKQELVPGAKHNGFATQRIHESAAKGNCLRTAFKREVRAGERVNRLASEGHDRMECQCHDLVARGVAEDSAGQRAAEVNDDLTRRQRSGKVLPDAFNLRIGRGEQDEVRGQDSGAGGRGRGRSNRRGLDVRRQGWCRAQQRWYGPRASGRGQLKSRPGRSQQG